MENRQKPSKWFGQAGGKHSANRKAVGSGRFSTY